MTNQANTTTETGPPTERTLFARAKWAFEEMYLDFAILFDYFFDGPVDDECYVMKGPHHFIMARAVYDNPNHPDGYWLIAWMELDGDMTMRDAFDLIPYPLPEIAWHRGLSGRRELQFYKVDRLLSKLG